MNRRMLLQITAPTVVIGAVLFGVCLASVWSINRLQANLAQILSENVTSLKAAQELEIQLRQLRFHSFLNVIEPRCSTSPLGSARQAIREFGSSAMISASHSTCPP